jgi:RNA polymerase sigma-70 factor (ECF subfamily)
LFNEGYKASQGDELVRRELCDEAIRLTMLLMEHPSGDQPQTHALLALTLLSGARLSARVAAAGNLLLLAEQDRSLWDRAMIQRGLFHLNRSAAGEEISEFHLQAGIAYCHCTAATYEATDWTRILSLYDLLVGINPSPVIALNRAVAISRVCGPEAALEAVEVIRPREVLENYYLFHAALAQFHLETGEPEQAARRFRRALELTGAKSERAFLARKLEECETRQAG